MTFISDKFFKPIRFSSGQSNCVNRSDSTMPYSLTVKCNGISTVATEMVGEIPFIPGSVK